MSTELTIIFVRDQGNLPIASRNFPECRLVINLNLYDTLTLRQREFLLGHEVEHFIVAEKHDTKRDWTAAGDYARNPALPWGQTPCEQALRWMLDNQARREVDGDYRGFDGCTIQCPREVDEYIQSLGYYGKKWIEPAPKGWTEVEAGLDTLAEDDPPEAVISPAPDHVARLAEARWLLLAYREDGYPLNYDEWRQRRAAFLRTTDSAPGDTNEARLSLHMKKEETK